MALTSNWGTGARLATSLTAIHLRGIEQQFRNRQLAEQQRQFDINAGFNREQMDIARENQELNRQQMAQTSLFNRARIKQMELQGDLTEAQLDDYNSPQAKANRMAMFGIEKDLKETELSQSKENLEQSRTYGDYLQAALTGTGAGAGYGGTGIGGISPTGAGFRAPGIRGLGSTKQFNVGQAIESVDPTTPTARVNPDGTVTIEPALNKAVTGEGAASPVTIAQQGISDFVEGRGKGTPRQFLGIGPKAKKTPQPYEQGFQKTLIRAFETGQQVDDTGIMAMRQEFIRDAKSKGMTITENDLPIPAGLFIPNPDGTYNQQARAITLAEMKQDDRINQDVRQALDTEEDRLQITSVLPFAPNLSSKDVMKIEKDLFDTWAAGSNELNMEEVRTQALEDVDTIQAMAPEERAKWAEQNPARAYNATTMQQIQRHLWQELETKKVETSGFGWRSMFDTVGAKYTERVRPSKAVESVYGEYGPAEELSSVRRGNTMNIGGIQWTLDGDEWVSSGSSF
jgi:hypothetical protein